jgi:hypothetical protein
MSRTALKVVSVAKSVDSQQFRSQRGRLGGGDTSWAWTEDGTAHTRSGRRALLDKFEDEGDPEGRPTIQERAKHAGYARKAHVRRLAMKVAQALHGRRES